MYTACTQLNGLLKAEGAIAGSVQADLATWAQCLWQMAAVGRLLPDGKAADLCSNNKLRHSCWASPGCSQSISQWLA